MPARWRGQYRRRRKGPGRGEEGGVKLVRSKEDAKAFAQQWLGKRLVTYQTDANQWIDSCFQNFFWSVVSDFLDVHATFRPAPLGFEAGTPPIASVIGLGATLNYLANLDQAAVESHEAALHALLVDGLKQRQGIQLLGSPHLALVSFVVEGVHNADLAHLLTEQGIAVRAGHHCAMPLLKSFGLAGAIRVSLALYNDSEDLERFFDALDQALELLQ